MHSKTIEPGLSDFHKMTITTMKCTYTRQKPVKITYRDYTKFNKEKFTKDFARQSRNLQKDNLDTNTAYNNLIITLKNTLAVHAPIKHRLIRGNQAPFINKTLSRAIMHRSKLRNKYNKSKSTFDWIAWKNQRNLCVKLRRQAIREHFKLKCKNGPINNKQFWKMVKPFISNKTNTDHNDIILIEDSEQIRDRQKVAEKLNEFFTDIIFISTGKQVIPLQETNHEEAIMDIIIKYENHISINNIKTNNLESRFSFELTSTNEVEALIRKIKTNKPMGIDTIPPKILVLLKESISEPVKNIINLMVLEGCFLDQAKISSITPAYIKGERTLKTNYRPISILPAVSKLLEKFMFKQISNYFEKLFQEYLSGFRRGYGCQHVLMRLIENWKLALDNKKIIAALSMDLSKAFDCLQHDLIIAKLRAYGFDMQALKLIYSYLSNRIQSVTVKDAYSSTSTVLSGVPQGSLLGGILYNIQFNDIFDITDESGLYNFADDNNLSAIGDTVEEAKSTLKQQTTNVLKWFDENHLIANPEKFHLMFLLPNKTEQAMNEQLLINNTTLDGEPSITLLGMEIDNSLTFNTHIGNLCKKAASQLNVLKRLSRFMGYNERRIIMQSFILSNFNYCALIWHFCSESNTAKIEKIQERALRLVLDDYISDYSTLLKNRVLMH